jgi:hypothetical protein
MSSTGRCLCGAVTFTADEVQTHLHACHCSMCRRWSGSTLMAASVGRVSFEGEENVGVYSSSDWAERGFCKRCGTNLFYRLKPDSYVMSMGTFDDPEQFTLEGEIFVDTKPSFFDLAGDHERLTEAEFMASIQQS